MKAVRGLIEQAAASDSRILILGENGTGKELVAREVHVRSARAAGPSWRSNCAAIPENLIESELFGHEKGAFTSALQRRRGKVEMARQGDALPRRDRRHVAHARRPSPPRAAGDAFRAGRRGEQSLSVDVRVISATNKDIRAGDRKGTVPGGPVLPHQRGSHHRAAPARPARRHARPRGVLHGEVQAALGAGAQDGFRGGDARSSAPTTGRATSGN